MIDATVNVNGRISDARSAVVSVFDHGFLFGDGVYETLSVESTSSDALDVAGGLELGVDLSAENGGVPETAIILVNGPTCPPPLVAIATTIQGLGSLSTCLYPPSGAAFLGTAALGTARLQ